VRVDSGGQVEQFDMLRLLEAVLIGEDGASLDEAGDSEVARRLELVEGLLDPHSPAIPNEWLQRVFLGSAG
jgi:hypothetical protein